MRVKCLDNLVASLPARYVEPDIGLQSSSPFPVSPGRDYDVLAVEMKRGLTFFYVMDDWGASYPVAHPSPLFEVTDRSLPHDWVLGLWEAEDASEIVTISFSEWADDIYFHERLVSGESDAVLTLRRRRPQRQ